jgi:hypothetical protein
LRSPPTIKKVFSRIYERFEKQRLNPAFNPRFVTEEYHQGALIGFTENLAKDAISFDRVSVVNRVGQTLFDSAARENRHTGPYEALLKGPRAHPGASTRLALGWERVRTLAEARHSPRDHLEQIGQHRNRVSDLGKARAHIDGMKHLDLNIAALSRDPPGGVAFELSLENICPYRERFPCRALYLKAKRNLKIT